MMRPAATIKPALVHIRAFIAESSAISASPYFNAPHITVITRKPGRQKFPRLTPSSSRP
jgi:hypothetical protein